MLGPSLLRSPTAALNHCPDLYSSVYGERRLVRVPRATAPLPPSGEGSDFPDVFVRFECRCSAFEALRQKQRPVSGRHVHTRRESDTVRLEGGGSGCSRRAMRRGSRSTDISVFAAGMLSLPRPTVANEAEDSLTLLQLLKPVGFVPSGRI
jgi:hypothetical protein